MVFLSTPLPRWSTGVPCVLGLVTAAGPTDGTAAHPPSSHRTTTYKTKCIASRSNLKIWFNKRITPYKPAWRNVRGSVPPKMSLDLLHRAFFHVANPPVTGVKDKSARTRNTLLIRLA